MRIAILGSDSFIGQHLVKHFGTPVTAVTHKELDLTRFEDVKEYFDKHLEFEYVILCATVGGHREKEDPEDTVEQNLRMFMNVVSFAHRFKKVIWFSSGADQSSRYGFSKRVMERLSILERNVVCLRIFGCFGVGERSSRFLSTCIREGHIDIEQDRYFDYFSVKDVCRVVEQCFIKQKVPWRIDLVYKEKYTLSQLAEMIGATCTVQSESTNEYTGIRGQLDCFNLEFEPMSLLLQKFREDYTHNQHLLDSSRDEPQEETHHS